MDRQRDLVVRALERGLIEPTGIARALGRATGLSRETAARWVRGVPVAPENAAKLRAVLGLDQNEETHRRS